MGRKRLIAATSLLCLAALAAVVSWRVILVNDAEPKGETLVYLQGEKIPYGAADDEEGDSAATMTVLGASLVTGEELPQLAPCYEDQTIASGGASEVKMVLVRVRLGNESQTQADSVLPLLSARENAWGNGVLATLVMDLNPELESLQLQPGEAKEVTVPFAAYDTQFGFNFDAWRDFGERGLHLTLQRYPDDVVIELGDFLSVEEFASLFDVGEDSL